MFSQKVLTFQLIVVEGNSNSSREAKALAIETETITATATATQHSAMTIVFMKCSYTPANANNNTRNTDFNVVGTLYIHMQKKVASKLLTSPSEIFPSQRN